MMMLKQLRTQHGLSQQKLANKLGVSRSTVAMWETAKSQPDNSLLIKCAQIFNVSVDTLLGNDFTTTEKKRIIFSKNLKYLRRQQNISQKRMAEMLYVSQQAVAKWETDKSTPNPEMLNKIADILGTSVDYLLGRSQSPTEKKSIIKAPVLGYVAAGVPIEQIEDILDYEELDPESFNPTYEYFGLKIKGDSMQPRIADGDVVIVRKQPNVESGEIAIVCVNGDEATCKQVKKHSDGLSLISFNPAFEPMYFTAKEVEQMPITILGKVVELRGKF